MTEYQGPKCRKCDAQLMWKQPYHQGDLPVNPDGRRHSCKASLFQNLEQWKVKWNTVYKYQCPIFCNMCRKSYKYDNVCQHIRNDGFIEGVDTAEFYGDKWSAVQRRKNIKADKKRKEEKLKGSVHEPTKGI